MAAPGVDLPDAVYPNEVRAAGARAVPGAVAWLQADDDFIRATVWLSDQNGTRAVGTARRHSPIAGTSDFAGSFGLELTSGTVSWNTDQGTASAPVLPPPESPVITGTFDPTNAP